MEWLVFACDLMACNRHWLWLSDIETAYFTQQKGVYHPGELFRAIPERIYRDLRLEPSPAPPILRYIGVCHVSVRHGNAHFEAEP